MSIQVNSGATAVNWEALLSKLGDVQQTTDAAGKTSFTVTMQVGGETKTCTFGIPDDLEIPKTIDDAAINSLCDKLLAGKDLLNFSDADIKEIRDNLTNIFKELQTSDAAPAASGASLKKTIMFDLYRMMALLVEVAQKQRDAAREQRLAENMQIQSSILAQAEQQRTAAVTAMIASFACCAIQLGASAYVIGKETAAFKTQVNTLETSGVNAAKAGLSEVKTELANFEGDVMHGAKNNVPLTPEARDAKIAELKLEVAAGEKKLDSAYEARRSDLDYMQATRDFAKFETYNTMLNAAGQVVQGLISNVNQIMQSKATEKEAERQKASEDLDQTKDLFGQAQELVNEVIKLMQSVIAAESQSMRDAIQV